MLEGVINEEAATLAKEAGFIVVIDKCMGKKAQQLKEQA